MKPTTTYKDKMIFKPSEDHRRQQSGILNIHKLRSAFRLEQFRLVAHRDEPSVASYLAAMSFGFDVQAIQSPAFVCDESKKVLYPHHQIHARAATFGETSYDYVCFECWGIPKAMLADLPEHLAKDDVPKNIIVQKPRILRPSIWASNEFAITQEAGLYPNHVWLCPVRIWGQTRDGANFLHDLVTPYAEELRQNKAKGLEPTAPESGIIRLTPKPPVLMGKAQGPR